MLSPRGGGVVSLLAYIIARIKSRHRNVRGPGEGGTERILSYISVSVREPGHAHAFALVRVYVYPTVLSSSIFQENKTRFLVTQFTFLGLGIHITMKVQRKENALRDIRDNEEFRKNGALAPGDEADEARQKRGADFLGRNR